MNQLKYISTIVILFLSLNSNLFAQSKVVNVVTTAVPFLRIGSDARANSMGATGIATAPDANAAYWNPGKIPFVQNKGEINANYTPWLREWASDMYLASASGYYKITDNEAIHGSLNYFKPGDLQFADNNGNHLQSYRPYEFGMNMGYSRKLTDKVALGLSLKYIHSNLANGIQNGQAYNAGNAFAADLGFYYDLKNDDQNGWAFGAALSNLGSKISYTDNQNQKNFLPANLGVGASYTKIINEDNKLSFGLDINKLLVPTPPASNDTIALDSYMNKAVVNSWFSSFTDAPGGFSEELREIQISIGAEYWYNNLFALRAGYFYEHKTKGDRKYFATGAGLRYSMCTINFSYLVPSQKGTSKNPLSNSIQVGVAIHLIK